MSAPSDPTIARLVLRYRSGSDVLTGMVEVDTHTRLALESITEQPDTDTTLSWQRFGPAELLHDFQVVHALSRWQSDQLTMLPRAVAHEAHALIVSASEHALEFDSPLARLQARVEHRVDLPLTAFERDLGERTMVERGNVEHAQLVATSLRSLATALEASLTEHDHDEFTLEAERTFTFCRLIEELAGSLADGDGLPACGTSAAARAAVRGGLPISQSERDTIRLALTTIDEPSAWLGVSRLLDTITRHLESADPGAAHHDG